MTLEITDKNINIEEPVKFVLEIKNNNDCLINPYQIDSVKIYFVAREFITPSATLYELSKDDQSLKAQYEEARDEVCLKKLNPVVVASTANLTLSGLQTVDGIILVVDDRILVKNQIDLLENGIYIVSSSSWERTDSLVYKSYVFAESGIVNIGNGWFLSTKNPVVGTSDLKFLQFSINGSPSSPDIHSDKVVSNLKLQKDASVRTSDFYYKDAEVVKIFGGYTDPNTSEFYPAWLNPDFVAPELKDKVISDNLLSPIYNGDNVVPGKFELIWDPSGYREGDYFICWTWRPTFSNETVSSHFYFSLNGGIGLTASIPTHRTNPEKYNILFDRYTAEMFKTYLSNNDLSPLVIKGFNEAVGAGFIMIENLANQIIDLLDANATHEQFLPLLSNMFALKIKSSDPTLWRRQIKKAIPNFKRKGTIVGLENAFKDAGMELIKLTKLWQIRSKYIYQEHFVYDGVNTEFTLSQPLYLPVDTNFELWFRASDGSWEEVTDDAVILVELYSDHIIWIGDIEEGDSIRILYPMMEIPGPKQSIEDYIRTLYLMDTRDERDQEYPPKNWNTRVLEEDDPMFNILIPVKHPIKDPIIWGWIRTEFPYSENAYNMDSYNGSKRESLNPCDIDKEFIDSCSDCQASVFNIDLEVEGLSDASFYEAQQVVEEFMPFHSLVHTFNLNGSKTELMGPAEEQIEALITISGEEVLIAGEGQNVFNRDVSALELENVRRDVLASFSSVESPEPSLTWAGTLKNTKVCLYSSSTSSESDLNDPSFRGLFQGFNAYNINTSYINIDPFESSNLLEVLGLTNRYYTITSINTNYAEIYDDVNPLVIGPLFEYRISNLLGSFTLNIDQTTKIIFSDANAEFYSYRLVSQKDVDDSVSIGPAWTLNFNDKEYKILDFLPDGSLLLEEVSTIAPISGWELINALSVVVQTGAGGFISTQYFGFVEVTDPPISGLKVRIGDYICLDWFSSPLYYRIKSLKKDDENKFYIENYNSGTVAGVLSKIYRRIIEHKVGQIAYEGLKLESFYDLEASLSISNGASIDPENINSENIKENYLIFINSEYYNILDVTGSNITIEGPLDSYTKIGIAVEFNVYKFTKESLSIKAKYIPDIPKFDFGTIDRSGKALIYTNQDSAGLSFLSKTLNSTKYGHPIDVANQQESIEYKIEYKEEK